MIASSILFDTDVTFGAIFSVGRDVIGSLRIISTLCQPLLDGDTIGGRMILTPAFEAERGLAVLAGHSSRQGILCPDNCITIDSWTES